MTDITELTSVQKNANIHRLSRLIAYAPNDELRQMAVEVEHYTDQLIEALEKAQAQSSKWLEAYHKAVSIGARYEERIAELESRTVKLPDLRQIVSGDRYVWSDGVYNYSQDVKVALAAAGIKVEAE
ncbi:TPA: hypothetical protein L8Q21_002439 [Klebsiella pneumoniae]|nr:hypothetical protein [Klebsiella pneumoniae]